MVKEGHQDLEVGVLISFPFSSHHGVSRNKQLESRPSKNRSVFLWIMLWNSKEGAGAHSLFYKTQLGRSRLSEMPVHLCLSIYWGSSYMTVIYQVRQEFTEDWR